MALARALASTRIDSMSRPILIVDDFHPFPGLIREYALEARFSPVEYEGHTYEGIGVRPVDMESVLADAVGFPVEIAMQFFRLGVKDDNLTVWIHADTICADHACVWYLTPPELCRGGTAFWRHKALGWDRLPPGRIDQATADRINADGQTDAAWNREAVAEMAWNRAAIYPTSLFHSRWPKQAAGNNKHDGRLIWCAFFNEKRND